VASLADRVPREAESRSLEVFLHQEEAAEGEGEAAAFHHQEAEEAAAGEVEEVAEAVGASEPACSSSPDPSCLDW
jgi:predicted urease superfamily metal-dependent hydrolase